MNKIVQFTIVVLLVSGCIKMDSFLFDCDEAVSVTGCYRGLPLYSGTTAPSWITDALVERDIYFSVPEGVPVPVSQLVSQTQYLHGAFLKTPQSISADTCPLAGKGVTFLYVHGNSGDMFRYWYRAVALWSMGANVFIFTHRGYGLSKGEPTREHILEDADAAVSYVKSRTDVDTAKIIVYGYSMGGIGASYLAGPSKQRGFAGIILESALDFPEQIPNRSTGITFPDGFFMGDAPFNGPAFIKGTPYPVLHIHGGSDMRVPIEQAYTYFETLKNNPAYTHYIGKSDKPDEQWIRTAGHRNIPVFAFKAELHLADYWDDPANASHCCINPFEYGEPQFGNFLEEIGKTNGEEMLASAAQYRRLIGGWVSGIIE